MCYYAVGTTNVASEQYELLLEGVLKSSHTQLSLWWTPPVHHLDQRKHIQRGQHPGVSLK